MGRTLIVLGALGFLVAPAGKAEAESSAVPDGLQSPQAEAHLLERYDEDYREVKHKDVTGAATMEARPARSSVRNELRSLEQKVRLLKDLDVRNKPLEDAKKLLRRMEPGARLLLKITLDGYVHWHWDRRGEVKSSGGS